MAPFDPLKHHRHSIRLKDYDYAQAGAYYVTFVVQNRESLFGEIVDGKFQANEAGQMLASWWVELTHKFPSVETDEFVIMPNHFHGIVVITGVSVGVDLANHAARRVDPPNEGAPKNEGAHAGAPLPVGRSAGVPLSEIVQWFKTMTTNAYIRSVKESGWVPFAGKLWQRNYYERVVRDETDLESIRKYIVENPLAWERDNENPLLGMK